MDWALDVPMYYVQNGKEYVKALGLDFKVRCRMLSVKKSSSRRSDVMKGEFVSSQF